MKALGRLKPELNVTGIVTTAENSPDANAQLPGDIFFAKNGKSIMVDNTDAEGRLVLTDGLHLAGEEKATHIIDIATLTGACVRALGTSIAGIMGNNQQLVQSVIRSGQNHGEGFWELPLPEEYKELLKTPCADMSADRSQALSRQAFSCRSSFLTERPGLIWTSPGPFWWKSPGSTMRPAQSALASRHWWTWRSISTITSEEPEMLEHYADVREQYEFQFGPIRGRLATALDILTDALTLVGQHGIYCRSQRQPNQPSMDVRLILRQIEDSKGLVIEALEALAPPKNQP
jgi:hypothetical protein